MKPPFKVRVAGENAAGVGEVAHFCMSGGSIGGGRIALPERVLGIARYLCPRLQEKVDQKYNDHIAKTKQPHSIRTCYGSKARTPIAPTTSP
jgi:hypothetical protein